VSNIGFEISNYCLYLCTVCLFFVCHLCFIFPKVLLYIA